VIRFDRMYERDGQTDGQTPHDGKGRAAKMKPSEMESHYSQLLIGSRIPLELSKNDFDFDL